MSVSLFPDLTSAQFSVLHWLATHTGDGMFDIDGVLLAAGERAGVMRMTWNKLCEAGFTEFYRPNNKGRGRLRVTQAGLTYLEKNKSRPTSPSTDDV